MDLSDWIKRFFKRLYIKAQLNLRKAKFGDIEEEVEYRKTCLVICRNLIKRPDTKLLITTISGKRYIRNESLGMFVVLQDRHINIVNHVYNYSVFLSLREWERLMYVYDHENEKRRLDYEDKMKSQIDHSLHKILETLIRKPQEILNDSNIV
jgi:hypothetical protein